jgi:uncharacterized Zn-binding protein involved in type VI secretion
MLAAARVQDPHICPMVDPGPKPHVGGPVLAPGCPSVRIGNQPAARTLDKATCSGPPDTIVKGSGSVLIGGKPAARITDTTAHGGAITGCWPTVLVGGPTVVLSPVAARAARRPTAAEIAEIQAALDAGDRQHAIDLTVQYYGIDVASVPGGPRYSATDPNYGTTNYDGTMTIGPAGCASPEVLATTIVHEGTHSRQAAALRAQDPSRTGWPAGADAVNYDEVGAYQAELDSASNTGLDGNAAEHGLASTRRTASYDGLPSGQQTESRNGRYPP